MHDIDYIIPAFIVIFALAYIHKMQVNYVLTQTENFYYSFKHKLTMAVVNEEININSDFFYYMDSVMSEFKNKIPFLNLTTLYLFYRKPAEMDTNLMLIRESRDNEVSKQLYDEFIHGLEEALQKRHFILTALFKHKSWYRRNVSFLVSQFINRIC